jgi:hypothetical protein
MEPIVGANLIYFHQPRQYLKAKRLSRGCFKKLHIDLPIPPFINPFPVPRIIVWIYSTG